MHTTPTDIADRDAVIATIRTELRRRSGKSWSVTGGRGTAWGWITIQAPPARRHGSYYMTDTDQAELAALLGLRDMNPQGVLVPDRTSYRVEYVDRASGRTPSVAGVPDWD
ncbi:MAG: hypothetical protein DLM61_19530 [Pseudonocardiales bacterium]|nr:MAG: hypothetical protein DLM61_19530 [Pseudonocardiales bacterium]